jgi:hypothetical protein
MANQEFQQLQMQVQDLTRKVQELSYLFNKNNFSDNQVFNKKVRFNYGIGFGGSLPLDDGADIVLGTGTGTKIGTSSSQLLGFWGVTPVNQPEAIGNLTVTGADQDAAARNGVNNILIALRESGIIDT